MKYQGIEYQFQSHSSIFSFKLLIFNFCIESLQKSRYWAVKKFSELIFAEHKATWFRDDGFVLHATPPPSVPPLQMDHYYLLNCTRANSIYISAKISTFLQLWFRGQFIVLLPSSEKEGKYTKVPTFSLFLLE